MRTEIQIRAELRTVCEQININRELQRQTETDLRDAVIRLNKSLHLRNDLEQELIESRKIKKENA
ncbi:MAG: hypothetical protein MOGMAGMI_02024 [Candidatus Omnitrophica bacterium]|jgi:hypothetical protein|nr:hypothetical protein [Candidatus Omnitrophota bacterium]